MLSISVFLKSGKVVDSLAHELYQGTDMLRFVDTKGRAYAFPYSSIDYLEVEDVEEEGDDGTGNESENATRD